MKPLQSPAAVVLEPAATTRAAVIWLHGLGADGHDFVPIVPELQLPEDSGVRFVFPHAPVRPVTLNGGLPMRAWYDIVALSRDGLQDEVGIRASERLLRGLIAEQVASGVPASRIVVAGFSQGGAVALHTALRHPEALGGLLALSTYLPLAERLAAEASAANRGIGLLMQHGRHDGVVPYDLGTASRDHLQQLGYAVDWQDYPMQHEVCLEQIRAIGAWLRRRIG